MTLKINETQCDTCIFGKRSPITPERFEELKKGWESRSKHQECHQATIEGEHVGCRGHYEAARRNELPYVAVAIVREQLGLPLSIPPADCLQIAERLGWVTFVPVEKEDTDVE